MNEIVTASSRSQCKVCKILKTARMTEESANNKGNHRCCSPVSSSTDTHLSKVTEAAQGGNPYCHQSGKIE